MWYTVLHDGAPIGFVELGAGGLVAARMLRLQAYSAIRATTRAATDGLLRVGLFGGALPALPPFPAERLRLRRAINRAARLEIALMDARGAIAGTSFVNVLETSHDDGVVVVAAFGDEWARVGSSLRVTPRDLRGGAARYRGHPDCGNPRVILSAF